MDNQNLENIYSGLSSGDSEPKNEYSKYDTLTAILLIPLAYFLVRAANVSEFPLGRLLLSVLLFILAGFYLKKHNVRLTENKFAFGCAVFAMVLSLGLIITSNEAVQALIAFITGAAYLYFVFAAPGNSAERYPSSLFPLEMLKAAVIMPFGSIGCAFEAISSTRKSQKIGKNILFILMGLAIAFIPALIVFALLSYDSSFKELSNKILDLGDFDIFSFASDLMFTVPLVLLSFGALYSSKCRRFADILTAEKCERVSKTVRFAPIAMVCAAVAPFIFIYSVFFASQLDYYLSAFSGVLPDGLSYADYARNGFFELCTVSAINALMILCTSVFCRPDKNDKPHTALKIANTLISFLTLILIATAISKMVLYIDTYGLTEKRVLSSAFMIFLAVMFLALIIKQFAKKTNVIITAIIAAVIITSLLAFSNISGVIASYNTDRYLSGELENFEPENLLELGDSGIIHLDRIAREAPEKSIREKAKKLLISEALGREDDESIFSITIPSLRADSVLDKYRNKSLLGM